MKRNPCEVALEKYIKRKYNRDITVVTKEVKSGSLITPIGKSKLEICYDKVLLFVEVVRVIEEAYGGSGRDSEELYVTYFNDTGSFFTFYTEKEANTFGSRNIIPGERYEVKKVSPGNAISFKNKVVTYDDAYKKMEKSFR